MRRRLWKWQGRTWVEVVEERSRTSRRGRARRANGWTDKVSLLLETRYAPKIVHVESGKAPRPPDLPRKRLERTRDDSTARSGVTRPSMSVRRKIGLRINIFCFQVSYYFSPSSSVSPYSSTLSSGAATTPAAPPPLKPSIAVSLSGIRVVVFTTGPSDILFTVTNTAPSVATATKAPTSVPTPKLGPSTTSKSSPLTEDSVTPPTRSGGGRRYRPSARVLDAGRAPYDSGALPLRPSGRFLMNFPKKPDSSSPEDPAARYELLSEALSSSSEARVRTRTARREVLRATRVCWGEAGVDVRAMVSSVGAANPCIRAFG